MIKVHHLEHSRSHRILWLLEEIGQPYEIVRYKRDPVTRLAPPELKKVHPLGKSPVVEDRGVAIAESGAIIEYLARTYGKAGLWPSEAAPCWLEHTHWMHFAEGSAMLPLLLALYVGRLGEAGAPLHPRIESEITNHLDYMEKSLGDRPFFCGDHLTAADVQMSFVLEAADQRGRLSAYPRLKALIGRIRARPAYQRANERGGALELAPR